MNVSGLSLVRLHNFLNAIGAQTACTDFQRLNRRTDLHFRLVDIRQPSAARHVMRVAHVIAYDRTFATDVASLSHNELLRFFNRLDRKRVKLLSGKTVNIARRAG